jgi:hypothetical protein
VTRAAALTAGARPRSGDGRRAGRAQRRGPGTPGRWPPTRGGSRGARRPPPRDPARPPVDDPVGPRPHRDEGDRRWERRLPIPVEVLLVELHPSPEDPEPAGHPDPFDRQAHGQVGRVGLTVGRAERHEQGELLWDPDGRHPRLVTTPAVPDDRDPSPGAPPQLLHARHDGGDAALARTDVAAHGGVTDLVAGLSQPPLEDRRAAGTRREAADDEHGRPSPGGDADPPPHRRPEQLEQLERPPRLPPGGATEHPGEAGLRSLERCAARPRAPLPGAPRGRRRRHPSGHRRRRPSTGRAAGPARRSSGRRPACRCPPHGEPVASSR